jgi:hypothetical protein
MVFRWRLYEERNAVLDQNIGIQKPTTNNQIMVYQANNKNVSILGNSLIKRLSISENYPLSGGVHPIVTGYKTRAELVVGALGSTPLS